MSDGGSQETDLSVLCRLSLSSDKQPVVDLQPDRSDPRMRLKQNWSFREQESAIGDGDERSDRHLIAN